MHGGRWRVGWEVVGGGRGGGWGSGGGEGVAGGSGGGEGSAVEVEVEGAVVAGGCGGAGGGLVNFRRSWCWKWVKEVKSAV